MNLETDEVLYTTQTKTLREHRLLLQARDMSIVLWELDQWLRSKIKNDEKLELQDVRDKLNELISYNNIDLSI